MTMAFNGYFPSHKDLLTKAIQSGMLGRNTGTGGGGQALSHSTTTPYFCKKCGRTVSGKSVRKNVDVCQRCRVNR